MASLIQQYLSKDTHLNSAEFLRAAIREKIKRDAPELYSQLFKGVAPTWGSSKLAEATAYPPAQSALMK